MGQTVYNNNKKKEFKVKNLGGGGGECLLAQVRTKTKPNPQIKCEILVKKNLLCISLEMKHTKE